MFVRVAERCDLRVSCTGNKPNRFGLFVCEFLRLVPLRLILRVEDPGESSRRIREQLCHLSDYQARGFELLVELRMSLRDTPKTHRELGTGPLPVVDPTLQCLQVHPGNP